MKNKTIFMALVSLMVLLSFSYPTLAILDNGDASLFDDLDERFDVVLANWPSPGDYNRKVISRQSKKDQDYLLRCAEDMGPTKRKCNTEVRDEIFRNKSVSTDCCWNIVRGDKECNTAWMKLFFQFYQLKSFSSKRTIKTNEIWNKCSAQVEAISPVCNRNSAVEDDDDEPILKSDAEFDAAIAEPPSSVAYNRNMVHKYSEKQLKYLEKCAEKMGVTSDKLYIEMKAEILRNKDASRESCWMIVKGGKGCFMEWMKFFFQTYQLKCFDSIRVSKANEIWNRCSSEIGSISPISG